MRNTLLLLTTFIGFSCATSIKDPQTIVDKAMEASGSNLLNKAKVQFTFRGIDYTQELNDGKYNMTRSWEVDTLGLINDVLNNNGFERYVNGSKQEVIDSMATKYSNSINSVHYFAFLPYRLNDPAVIKEYLATETIDEVLYHKIQVTFKQEGGGKDHEDVFIYWINTQSLLIDFLAYSYLTDGGGMRFRKAYNIRTIKGLKVADYINLKPNKPIPLTEIGKAYEKNELKELSRIELNNITVELL